MPLHPNPPALGGPCEARWWAARSSGNFPGGAMVQTDTDCGIVQTTMLRRTNNLLWLFVALAFGAQSLLPAAAFAEVSMRCVGASLPCAHAVISPATESAMTGMACCHSVATCPPSAQPHSICGVSIMPGCQITVSPLGATGAANVPGAHRWLLHTSPALAPPALFATFVVYIGGTVPPSAPADLCLPSRHLNDLHGLRAPPVA